MVPYICVSGKTLQYWPRRVHPGFHQEPQGLGGDEEDEQHRSLRGVVQQAQLPGSHGDLCGELIQSFSISQQSTAATFPIVAKLRKLCACACVITIKALYQVLQMHY